jgi:hypothetical protein
MTSFREWLTRKQQSKGVLGDFARDALADPTYVGDTREAWLSRLQGAPEEVLAAFEKAWKQYQVNQKGIRAINH